MKKLIRHTALATFLLPLSLSSQKNYFSDDEFIIRSSFSAGQELLNNRISSMFTDPVMKNANWGFVVYDPKNKRIINS